MTPKIASMFLAATLVLGAACGGGGGGDSSSAMTWPTITAKVNGAPVTLGDGDNGVTNIKVKSLNVFDGDQVQLESSESGTWMSYTSGVFASDVTTTDTTWSGTVHYGLSTPGGTVDLDVEFVVLPHPANGPLTRVYLQMR